MCSISINGRDDVNTVHCLSDGVVNWWAPLQGEKEGTSIIPANEANVWDPEKNLTPRRD